MAIMGRLKGRGRRRSDGKRNPYRPEVAALETRALMSVNSDWTLVNPVPRVIPNLPGAPQVPIDINGVIASNHAVAPTGLYYVIDSYRADEPRGSMTLVPIGLSKQKLYQYAYNFKITLQASRSTNTPGGRYYNLFVGGTDGDGTNGKIIRLIVPENYAAALAPHPFRVVTPRLKVPSPHPRRGLR